MRRSFFYMLALTCLGASGHAETLQFNSDRAGATPAGWSSAMTNSGGEPRWEVIADASASSRLHVLGQLSQDKTSGRFPLAIYDRAFIKDGEVSVRCKAISGEVDQACGVVWRYRDPNNYYIARANALENNVVLFKVKGGERKSLAPKNQPSRAYGVKHPVPSGRWNEFQVKFQASLTTVFFNGEQLFEVEDGTFGEGGRVGLWTKADSVIYFDDFRFSGK